MGEAGEYPTNVIGLIPAAGQALRLSPSPCSKEIYPVELKELTQDGARRAKVAGQYLLEKFSFAQVMRTFIVLRKGKWDIPQYFGDGSGFGMDLGYLIMSNPNGVPFTLDQAFSFVENKTVVFGFPDILFAEREAFVALLRNQVITQADIVLGLFPSGDVCRPDLVNVREDSWVSRIVPRSSSSPQSYTWGIAVWTFRFTKFLHDFLVPLKVQGDLDFELSLSEVMQASLEQGLRIYGFRVSDRPFLDIGTPEGLVKAGRFLQSM